MEKLTLKDKLKKITDNRRKQGTRHSIDTVLMITIMATMSGFFGYRQIGLFAERYKKELIKYLEIKKNRVPSFSTIRQVLLEINHEEFSEIFKEWMEPYLKENKEKWISIDGKTIKGDKDFAHLVSFFTSDSKQVIEARNIHNKSNEIPLVQEMIKETPFKNVIFTLDALHCQKDTIKEIIDSGNDYLIQVKKKSKEIT